MVKFWGRGNLGAAEIKIPHTIIKIDEAQLLRIIQPERFGGSDYLVLMISSTSFSDKNLANSLATTFEGSGM